MAEEIKVEETVEDVKVDETVKEDAPVKEDAKTDEVKDDALEDKQKTENEGEKQLQDALNNIRELENKLAHTKAKTNLSFLKNGTTAKLSKTGIVPITDKN